MRNSMLLCAVLLSFQGALALDWEKDTGGKWNKVPEGSEGLGLGKVPHKLVAKRSWIVPQAVVHRGHAYLPMSQELQSAILKGHPRGQGVVAVVNGVSAGPSTTRIKTPYDVLCTLAQDGTNSEAMVDKGDRAALDALGAKFDELGRVPARSYLKIELAEPVDEILIKILEPKAVVETLTMILYF